MVLYNYAIIATLYYFKKYLYIFWHLRILTLSQNSYTIFYIVYYLFTFFLWLDCETSWPWCFSRFSFYNGNLRRTIFTHLPPRKPYLTTHIYLDATFKGYSYWSLDKSMYFLAFRRTSSTLGWADRKVKRSYPKASCP